MSITRVNTNFDAIFATNALKTTERALQTAMARISTGKRINYASDDPAGVGQLTIAKAQLSGSRVAQQNDQESLALLQFADSAMSALEDKLIDLRDLAIEAGNSATMSDAEAVQISSEYNTAIAAGGIVSDSKMAGVKWNGKALFDGSFTAQQFQVGGATTDTITGFSISTIGAAALGATTALGVTAATIGATATTAIGELDTALAALAVERGNVGRAMSSLEFSLEEQMSRETNYAAAVSAIGDADLAAEISKLTTSQILGQSAAAMLGQANIHSQTLLNVLM